MLQSWMIALICFRVAAPCSQVSFDLLLVLLAVRKWMDGCTDGRPDHSADIHPDRHIKGEKKKTSFDARVLLGSRSMMERMALGEQIWTRLKDFGSTFAHLYAAETVKYRLSGRASFVFFPFNSRESSLRIFYAVPQHVRPTIYKNG